MNPVPWCHIHQNHLGMKLASSMKLLKGWIVSAAYLQRTLSASQSILLPFLRPTSDFLKILLAVLSQKCPWLCDHNYIFLFLRLNAFNFRARRHRGYTIYIFFKENPQSSLYKKCAQMPISRRIDKEAVVHIHHGILLSR